MRLRTTALSRFFTIVAFLGKFGSTRHKTQERKAIRRLLSSSVTLVASLLTTLAQAQVPQPNWPTSYNPLNCDEVNSGLCPETPWNRNYEGKYLGHDEPALLFYSNQPGSGNSSLYRLTLPKDPPTLPTQDGTGGVFEFQLNVAFWFGMVLCDSQSFPNFTHICQPDTDENIFDDADPTSRHWIGHHPGAAFLELQFYAPGWINSFCSDKTRWCAALNIFSEQIDGATFTPNNADCINRALGRSQSVNHAFITKNGVPLSPPNPLGAIFGSFNYDANNVLQMNGGDRLVVLIHDSSDGLEVSIRDVTTRASGFMVASPANGFGQLVYDPTATSCTVNPYAFHPMYSTSSEHTRSPATAHSYNVSFSEEIGHFEFCNDADLGLNCTVTGVNDKGGLDADDVLCFTPSQFFFPPPPIVQIGGCIGTEFDFDGVSYRRSWPGTLTDRGEDRRIHPTPVRLTSPLFVRSGENGEEHGLENYDRVAFETDLPLIEFATSPPCDVFAGMNCVNPPLGAEFYPIFSIADLGANGCQWQFGGTHIPGTTNAFGGSSTVEFGPLLGLVFQDLNGSITEFLNFGRVLEENPCPAGGGDQQRD